MLRKFEIVVKIIEHDNSGPFVQATDTQEVVIVPENNGEQMEKTFKEAAATAVHNAVRKTVEPYVGG